MLKPRYLQKEVREWLRELVERHGTPTTARAIGVAEATVARAAGGLAIQAGTVVLIESAYRERRSAA